LRHARRISRFSRTLSILLVAAFPALAGASETCVDNIAQLQTAFVLASLQSQVSTIKLVQGTYPLSGQNNYLFLGPMTLLGGYTANCATRSVNPANTVVDLGGAGGALRIFQSEGPDRAAIGVDGLTFTNGTEVSLTTGLHHLVESNDPGDLTVTRSRFRTLGLGNGTTTIPVSFSVTSGTLRVEDVVVDDIESADQNGCSAWLELEGDSRATMNYATVDLSDNHDFCLGISGSSSFQFDIYNSIVWASDGTLSSIHGDPYALGNEFSVNIGSSIFHTYFGGGSYGHSNNLDVDPLWNAPASGNYHLQPASPAVNSGDILDPLGAPPTDVAGGARWIGSHPDRGAYESSVNDLASFVVTSTADAGAHTLRQAILDSNSSNNPATITFNIAHACPATIGLATPLPHITSPIIIDGYTQPGASANTDPDASNAVLCVLVKPVSGALADALLVPSTGANAASLVVRGLGFGGFGQPIMLLGGANHVIAGNQFGGSVAGVALPGAALQAISIGVNAGGSLVVGGQAIADRNVIGGAGFYGINVQSAVASSPDACQIVNNLIGVAANGVTPVPNFTGIGLSGSGCSVTSNRIVGNSQDAILINGGNDNVIQRNVLGVDVQGNGVFNSGAGVHITSGDGNVIGTSAGSSITSTLLANTIRFMVDGGVVASAGTGNSIRSNLIYENGATGSGMAIDLGVTGPTANDPDDTDGGPNLLQNFPIVSGISFATPPPVSATNVGATAHGAINGSAGTYRIDAYFANGCGAGGRGTAHDYAGAAVVTIPPGAMHAAFSFAVTVPNVLADATLALSATDAAGNTSEIGPCTPLDAIFTDGFE